TYKTDWEWTTFAFIFFASITGYNFVKYAGQAKLHHRSLTNQLKTIQIFSLFCFLGLVYFFFRQIANFIWTILVLGGFTFFYAVPFLPHKKNLRRLKGLKIFIIALVWTGATLWLPLVNHYPLFSLPVILGSLSYFFFVLALILPFEIRDVIYDDAELGTLPQRFGVDTTKKTGYVFLLIFVILTLLNTGLEIPEMLIRFTVALATGVFIFFSEKSQNRYYAAFWVEAVPILWFGLSWIANQ